MRDRFAEVRRGERTVALGERLATELFEHRGRTVFDDDDERVFCAPRKGTPSDGARYATTFRAALAKVAGYVPPFHDLRHTSITNATTTARTLRPRSQRERRSRTARSSPSATTSRRTSSCSRATTPTRRSRSAGLSPMRVDRARPVLNGRYLARTSRPRSRHRETAADTTGAGIQEPASREGGSRRPLGSSRLDPR